MKLWVITVARKPLDSGSVVDNIQKWGTGGINIDATRIGTADKLGGGGEKHNDFQGKAGWDRPWMHDPVMQDAAAERKRRSVEHAEELGRWPANVILQHKPECQLLGQTQVRPSNGSGRAGAGARGFQTSYVGGEKQGDGFTGGCVDDSGKETIDNWQCVEGCPVTDLADQSGTSKSGAGNPEIQPTAARGWKNKSTAGIRRMGHADEGTAARFFKQVKDDVGSDS